MLRVQRAAIRVAQWTKETLSLFFIRHKERYKRLFKKYFNFNNIAVQQQFSVVNAFLAIIVPTYIKLNLWPSFSSALNPVPIPLCATHNSPVQVHPCCTQVALGQMNCLCSPPLFLAFDAPFAKETPSDKQTSTAPRPFTLNCLCASQFCYLLCSFHIFLSFLATKNVKLSACPQINIRLYLLAPKL